MEINRHNYEAFLLDRLEGSLSEEDQRCLEEFLRLNPDCKAAILEEEPWFLEVEKLAYPDPGILKKKLPDASSGLQDHNFDLFSIARMEGDLTGEQEQAHMQMTDKDTEKSREWMEWQKTKLFSETLMFPDKERLYRRKPAGRKILWISAVSAAASIALLFMLFRPEPVVPGFLPGSELSHELVPGRQAPVYTADPGQEELPANNKSRPESLALPVKMEEADMKSGNTGMFSVKKEHAFPIGVKNEPVRPRDDLQARPLRISANYMRNTSPAGKVVPDRIEPLNIPPSSIHLSSLSIAQLYKMDLQDVVNEYARENDISLLALANAGIRGINKLAGSDISLLASHDEEGEISGFRLKSRHFSIQSPLERE